MPPPPNLLDPWRELDELDALRRRYENRHMQARVTADGFTREEVEALASVARSYDWMPPGVAMALTKAQFGKDHPITVDAARRAAIQQSDPASFWYRPGETVNARQVLPPGQRRLLDDDRDRVTPVVPVPTDPALRDAYMEAAGAGLVAPGMSGIFQEPKEDTGDTADVFYRTRQTYLDAGVPFPVIQEDGRPALIHGKRKLNDRGLWETDIEYLDERPERERGSRGGGVGALSMQHQAAQLGTSIKGTAQTLGMVANAPIQETTGLFRAAYSGEAPSFQSDLAVRVQNPELPAGGGFFVDEDSPLAQERRRREARYGMLDGHRISFGRAVASALPIDPNGRAYTIVSGLTDAAAQIWADPTSYGLGKADDAHRAAQLIRPDSDEMRAVGGLRGLIGMADPQTVDQALTGHFRPVVEAFAAETSPTAIWRMSGRRFTPDLANQIADATTPDDVSALIRGQIGTRITSVKDLATEATAPRRWRSVMPGPGFNPQDRQQTMVELERWMVNAKVPDDEIVSVLDDVARARGPAGIYNAAILRPGSAADRVLQAKGVTDPTIRSRMTRFSVGTHEDARHYFVDEIGNDVPVWGKVKIADEVIDDTGGPHLWSEMLHNWVDLPDARPIRTMTTTQQKVLSGDSTMRRAARHLFSAHDRAGQHRPVPAFFHGLQDQVWKKAALIRPAWTVRVVGEEQARMGAAGYDSMFRHPASFIAWRLGRKGGATDLAGNAWDEADEFKHAMSQTRDWIGDPTRVATSEFTTYAKGSIHEQDRFIDGWAGELAHLSRDPVASYVAGAPTLDDAVEWFWTGAGRQFRLDMAEMRPVLNNEQAARRYITDTVAARVQIKTGGNPELVDAVATGRLGDIPLVGDGLRGNLAATPKFREALASRLDIAPERVKGRIVAEGHQSSLSRAGAWWNRITDAAFGALMTERTNNLSRSQTFKQAYWDEAERLIPFMSPETRAEVVIRAREANLDGWQLGRRRIKRIERTRAHGDLTIDDVDELAKGAALDKTKDLLYDLSNRGQVWDAMRLVFPFGEAWLEVFTRWAKLANPATPRGLRTLRRFQQGMEGAQQGEQFGEFTGAPEGEGFFWTDEYGELRFNYPFSAGLNVLLGKLPNLPGQGLPLVGGIAKAFSGDSYGVPIPLSGRVEGLSMFGSLIPGLGPVSSTPVAWLLENKPDWSRAVLDAKLPVLDATVEEQLLPFGGPADDLAGLANVGTYLPPWAQRLAAATFGTPFTGPESDRAWMNAQKQVARYLASTGDFDLSTAAGLQALEEAAAEKARGLYFIRGVAGSTLPSAPAPDWVVEDKHGDMRRVLALVEEYHELYAEDPEGATEAFLDTYGEDTFLVTQSLSKEKIAELEPSRAFDYWVEDHPDVKRDLPNTYALFAAHDGSFDGGIYNAQFREGDRENISTEDWLAMVNNSRGWLVMDIARSKVSDNPTDEERAWLRQVEAQVFEEYPGYQDYSRSASKAPTKVMLAELERALEIDDVRATDAGQGLAIYWEGRQRAMERAQADGLAGFQRARSARPIRDWLRNLADAVIDEHPAFAPLWREVFEDEMANDLEEGDDDGT